LAPSCLGVAVRPPGRTAEQKIADLAARTHGVVTRQELLDAGLTIAEIKHRLDTGALIREWRGVYRVGHRAPSLHASYLAAVRACGDGALLCVQAAAHLYEIRLGRAPKPEVLTPTYRRIRGLRTRRVRKIDPIDSTVYKGIPITTVPRTLVDLAAELTPDDLAGACHAAQVRYRVTPEAVEAVLDRRPNSPGAGALRRVLRGDVRVALSKLERRFLELLEQESLPLPETNRPAGSYRVDCRWPDHALTVELDGYRYHSSRHAWEKDRRREREARARGDEFRRYTYGDVFEDTTLMLRELRALLDVAKTRASAAT
jgi:very-short-patch-repair endonuclease